MASVHIWADWDSSQRTKVLLALRIIRRVSQFRNTHVTSHLSEAGLAQPIAAKFGWRRQRGAQGMLVRLAPYSQHIRDYSIDSAWDTASQVRDSSSSPFSAASATLQPDGELTRVVALQVVFITGCIRRRFGVPQPLLIRFWFGVRWPSRQSHQE